MSLPTTDAEWITYLSLLHDAELPDLRLYNQHYELEAPLQYMHPEILRELGDRLQQVVIAWPQLVVDSLEERLEPEGFRLPGEESGDDDLWRVWCENDLVDEAQMGRVDALAMCRSYLAVGTNEEDTGTPLVTVESPLEVYAYIDPRTRRVAAALRRWCDESTVARTVSRYATLYLPNNTIQYEWTGGWKETGRDEHRLGDVSITPMINRGRVADRRGRSELHPILPLSNAANKIATDMMTAAEFVALPLRALWNASPDDLMDEQGNKLTAIQAMLGRLLVIPETEGGQAPQGFQFPAADLSNFHRTITQLAKLVSSIAGLPPLYLGENTENPASADAIRSNEARLVKRAERRQRTFGAAYGRTMRLVRRFQAGDWDPKLKRLETVWRDASTPTIAQKADAAVKLFQADELVTRRQAREDLNYTDGQIKRMEEDDAKRAEQDPLALMTRAAQAPQEPPLAVVGGDGERP